MNRRSVGDRQLINMVRLGVSTRRTVRSDCEVEREADGEENVGTASVTLTDVRDEQVEVDNDPMGAVRKQRIKPEIETLDDRMNSYLERMQELEEERMRMREENVQLREELNAAFQQRNRSPVRVEVQRLFPTTRPTRQAEVEDRQTTDDLDQREQSARFNQSIRFVKEGNFRRESLRSADRSMEERLRKMESAMQKIPGSSSTLRRCVASYNDSPFADNISSAEMPRKLTLPTMKLYDGTDDPFDHLSSYQQKMLIVPVSMEAKEAVMCKGFGISLTGLALQWFTNLPNGYIASFTDLASSFMEQFASSRRVEKQ